MKFTKRVLFAAGILVAAWFLLEAATAGLHVLLRGSRFPRQDYAAAIARISSERPDVASTNRAYDGGFRRFKRVEALHPYLGYVRDHHLNEDVNEYGYVGDSNPVQKRSSGRVIVAIFGGSFAQGVYLDARDALVESLHPTGEVVVVNCTAGGYKQPQQALELVYLLAAGAEFDIILNIDGFNDLALPIAENIPQGVHPIFPQAWFYRAGGVPDPDGLIQLGRLADLSDRRASWARRFACPWATRSILLCSLWKWGDARVEKKMARAQQAIATSSETGQPYAVTGPPFSTANDDATCTYLAQVWKTSSLEMDALCRANGIRYFHFLQPNQYVDGAKPMGDAERAVAFEPAHPYRQPVVTGYPHLRAAGEELRAAGVAFHDLTMVFENHPEPLYSDTCCHLNPEGYRIVARAIGTAIASQ